MGHFCVLYKINVCTKSGCSKVKRKKYDISLKFESLVILLGYRSF